MADLPIQLDAGASGPPGRAAAPAHEALRSREPAPAAPAAQSQAHADNSAALGAGALISLKHVHKRFGRLVVLNDVCVNVAAGESLVIIGASGSGKSVLIKHIVGLLIPDKGEVWFDNQRIDTMKQTPLMKVRQRFGFLFQMGALFDSINVFDNIAFPLREHTRKKPDEIARIVEEKLAFVGLGKTIRKMPNDLSGGQRKRVALARAIAMSPEVVLYDEPTTGLDPVRSDVINELILKLRRELKVTSVVVTHDMNSAFKVATRVVMLHEGRLIIDAPPAQLQSTRDPIVQRFIAGEASEEDLEALRTPAGGGAAPSSK